MRNHRVAITVIACIPQVTAVYRLSLSLAIDLEIFQCLFIAFWTKGEKMSKVNANSQGHSRFVDSRCRVGYFGIAANGFSMGRRQSLCAVGLFLFHRVNNCAIGKQYREKMGILDSLNQISSDAYSSCIHSAVSISTKIVSLYDKMYVQCPEQCVEK